MTEVVGIVFLTAAVSATILVGVVALLLWVAWVFRLDILL